MTMTDDEHEAILDWMWTVARRFCLLFSTKDCRITPPMIWVPGSNKNRAICRARAATGFTLRCTIGRLKERKYVYAGEPGHEGRVELPRPWTVFPDGIPRDGTFERFSYPAIRDYCGGKDHTTILAAIQRLKKEHQELVDTISDAHKTELARDIALFVLLEKQWKREEEVRAAAKAAYANLLKSQAEWSVDESPVSG